jgi:amino acid transporter
MPFLFVWTIVLAIPLIMSTGIIGLEQYLTYFLPNLSYWPMHLIGVGATAAIVILLYRKVESIKAITIGLWIVMLVAVGMTIAASYTNFHPSLAFHYPHAIMAFYLAMNIGVLGVLPWQKVAHASSVASLAVTHNWGRPAADAVTALILVTAMASVFAGLLGGSRVPYHAAPEGLFFAVFGRLHPKHDFPQVSLLVMGLITAVGSFFTLTTIINVSPRSCGQPRGLPQGLLPTSAGRATTTAGRSARFTSTRLSWRPRVRTRKKPGWREEA